jgi:hypothetical protein
VRMASSLFRWLGLSEPYLSSEEDEDLRDLEPRENEWVEDWKNRVVAQVRSELNLSETERSGIHFYFRDQDASHELIEDVIDAVLAVLRHTGPDSIPN